MSLFDAILAGKLTGGGGSLPKPIPYEYMPEGYPRSEFGTVPALEEQTISGFVENYGLYEAPITFNEIEVGRTYTVVFDGASYECVGSAFDGDRYIGNRGFVDGATESASEPFVILYAPDGTNLILCATSEESHTIAIYTTGEIIEPVAYKFMPDGYPKYEQPVVFEKADIVFIEVDPESGIYLNEEELTAKHLTVGEKYTVTWDGKEYENLVAYRAGIVSVAIGAGGLEEITDDLPFIIVVDTQDGNFEAFTNSTAATHSITITHEKITPIAYKFLPPVTKLYADSSKILYWDDEYTTGVTVAELRELIQAVPYTVFVMPYNALSCLALISFRDGGEYDVDIHTVDGAFMPIDYVGGR